MQVLNQTENALEQFSTLFIEQSAIWLERFDFKWWTFVLVLLLFNTIVLELLTLLIHLTP